MKLALNHQVVQGKGNIVSDMNGEKVMMNMMNGKYYNLGKIGGVIWDKIETPVTVKRIVEELLREFNVSSEQCEEHVMIFLNNLLEKGLITLEKESIAR